MRIWAGLFLVACTGGVEPLPDDDTSTDPTTSEPTTTPPDTGPIVDEVCDGIDNDGDGQIDEEGGPTSWADTDGDGFGDPDNSTTACDPGTGWVSNDEDCDDDDWVINPNAYDGCNGIDEDCDGLADDDHRDGWYLGTLDQAKIWKIDKATGNALIEVDFHGDSTLNYSSTDVLEAESGVAHQGVDNLLWKFDVCQETLEVVGPTNVSMMGGIAYGPDTRLFGFSHGTDAIVEVNTNTGNATVLYDLGFDAGAAGMAYDCSTETLYAMDIKSDTLYTVDSNSGALLTAVPLTQNLYNSNGMEWDHWNKQLIVAADGKLFDVDPATGQTTYVSTVSGALDEVNDLAFFPPCP